MASSTGKVTADDLEEARSALEVGRARLVELREQFFNGEDGISFDDVKAQEGVVEFAEASIERLARARARYEAQVEIQARKDLKSKALSVAPASGEALLARIDSLYAEAVAFVDEANAWDRELAAMVHESRALGVPDKGVTSDAHEGLGSAAGGDLLIDEVRLSQVNAKGVLGLLFQVVENGVVPSGSEANVAAARRIVGNLGKAAV